jgi:hypothetical protein
LQPLGNQELWKFVHSVYGTELGFSSNDEAGTSSSIVCGVSASAGEASPLSEVNQVQPSISLQQLSSPSPSLHSAQTSNDDSPSATTPSEIGTIITVDAFRWVLILTHFILHVCPSRPLHPSAVSLVSFHFIVFYVYPIIISATDGVRNNFHHSYR